jgi:hypothetical protein
MRRDLFAWTARALLVAALCAGCSGVPAPLTTPGEPGAGQPQRDGTPVPTDTVDRKPGTEALVTAVPSPKATQPGPSPDNPLSPDPVDPGLKGVANQAKEDLARRLAIPAAQIEVPEAQFVVWPDGSLGCPQPDMAYTQVPVDGALISLRAGERVFNYHSGGDAPFMCRRSTRDTSARD